jgi:hypothetical protein
MHTLSLHDALPISRIFRRGPLGEVSPAMQFMALKMGARDTPTAWPYFTVVSFKLSGSREIVRNSQLRLPLATSRRIVHATLSMLYLEVTWRLLGGPLTPEGGELLVYEPIELRLLGREQGVDQRLLDEGDPKDGRPWARGFLIRQWARDIRGCLIRQWAAFGLSRLGRLAK